MPKIKTKILIFIFVVSVFVLLGSRFSIVLATHSSFDLANLKEVRPDFSLAYDKIQVQQAWEFIKGIAPPLEEVILGVVDDGIDIAHPEFANVGLGRTPTGIQKSAHGTAVVGIIGADNDSVVSPTNYAFPEMNGVASGVLSKNKYMIGVRDFGDMSREAFGTAMNDLIAGRAKFINISLGAAREGALTEEQKFVVNTFSEEDFRLYSEFFGQYFREHSDVTFVVAAGNENVDTKDSAFVAEATSTPNVIIVGATKLGDTRFTSGLFASNFGAGVALSAPGEGIYAPSQFAAPLDLNDYWNPQNTTPTSTELLNVKRFFSGTSGATPLVTGVAAILKSIKPELTPAQIKSILISTADTILTDKPIGPRLNALRAVQSLIQPPTPTNVFFIGTAFRFNTAGYFNVVWQRNNDLNFASYKLFRATHPGVTMADALVATLTNQNQVLSRDENLAPGTYFYKVFVFNQAGISSPSNEISGRIFGSADTLFRIPGVPEPGDATFPPNVAIPDFVFDLPRFDCPRSIFNPDICTGPFTAAGLRIDEFGHVAKLRNFRTNVVNSKFNGIDNFQFVVHQLNDEFRFTFTAIDDSYFITQPEFGFGFRISIGDSRTSQAGITVGGGRVFNLFITNSAGVTNKAGTLNVAF